MDGQDYIPAPRPTHTATFSDISSWGIPTFPYPTTPDFPPHHELLRGFTRQPQTVYGIVAQRALTCQTQKWIDRKFLCLMDDKNPAVYGPGEPFLFWDDVASNSEVQARMAKGPLNVLWRKASNNWVYLGKYDVSWRKRKRTLQ